MRVVVLDRYHTCQTRVVVQNSANADQDGVVLESQAIDLQSTEEH